MTAVLDAWALVAALKEEVAGPRVERQIENGQASVSSIDLGEAYSSTATARRHHVPLWTGDPEIIALAEIVEVVGLRNEP